MKTKLIALLIFVAVPLTAAPTAVDFAPFSIIIDWTVRIDAVMSAQPHLVPPGPCAGVIEMRILDERGNVLAAKTARISPTAVESLEFTPARDAVGRVIVRPQISWVEYPPGPCRSIVLANSEVYSNSTGATQFVIHGRVDPGD